MAHKKDIALLAAVVTTGASSAFNGLDFSHFTFYIKAASVSTGGTVVIEALSPAGDWVIVSTTAVSGNGNTVIQLVGAFSQLRANVSARTDGTFDVTCTARGASH
jgi:hypothetical protein